MSIKTQTESDVVELERAIIQDPEFHKVIFFNDDTTPVEFVVHVLQSIFRKSLAEAAEITLQIHNSGNGIAGVYTEEIAFMKKEQTVKLARQQNFPLKVEVEVE